MLPEGYGPGIEDSCKYVYDNILRTDKNNKGMTRGVIHLSNMLNNDKKYGYIK